MSHQKEKKEKPDPKNTIPTCPAWDRQAGASSSERLPAEAVLNHGINKPITLGKHENQQVIASILSTSA
jgi:hypothetical protein